MNIVVISALGNATARRCVDSLLSTTPFEAFDLFVMRDRSFRERTLNRALDRVGTEDDVLFVGDDIQFTPGWHDALVESTDRAEIVGLSMLDAASGLVQDRGYDFVRIEGRAVPSPRDRGADPARVERFGWRACDAVCGCFLHVRADVFRSVPRFREEGANRWGEMIFAAEARRAGARIGVVDHFLVHAANSSKQNSDPRLRSTSFRVEAPIWEKIAERWIDPAWVRHSQVNSVEPELIRALGDFPGKIWVYGIGTVTDTLAPHLPGDPTRIAYCSGLAEEVGSSFRGHAVVDVHSMRPADEDWILITPLHIGERLFHMAVRPRLPAGFCGRVSSIQVREDGPNRNHVNRDLIP